MAYQTVNPFNNQLIKAYPNHSDADIEATLRQADALYHSEWAKGSIDQRLPVLHKLADLLESHQEELAKIATQEMGKLIAQSRSEVQICAQIARYYADNAKKFLAPVKYDTELGDAWVEHHPIGIIMAVEPWNFPYYQLIRVLAPNLAAGNPVICKHASIVPHCAEAFAHLVREAGAPEGAWTNLFISSDQVSAIIADPRVQGAALTGSEKAGSAVASQAAKHIKKSTLELGGNDVFIVLDDADLEKAVKTGVQARLANAGQVCTAAKRFIVHQKVADQFLRQFTDAFQQVKMGDPLDESTTLGPLSSKDAVETLSKQVSEAVQKGAKLHFGGKPANSEGNFFEPTILTHITRDNPAYFEEFFGPVAQIYVVQDDEEAVRLANDSHYGLGGAIFSRDIERAKGLASRIETGMVYINWLTDTAAELPFGGVKRSGFGRELSDLGIKEFVNQKLVVVRQ
ncbi:NAD-dependent succinate-semialdehyde dehydrogenase [Kosakonia cowanii]|jgi:succinate-semialdehyde dehydrogenase/glutarate-semialdehyde dehydrogenase|uniref:NAD-dependent succinate-semialdehyde dehydrogenase n=1 Tax=Kosakonia cowanii TaxID=208223 RepID=UPI000B960EFF|nr:NAD-dependent succinate-semialdehyde dehydrogenase [Kosakonia cowanii]AST67831.1 succinate-semialdehyde dehydrogenase [Kosakonia cowanii]MDT3410674.1 succinate-semialdehyde dehydrogenase/glutarate-semialdehyde dehydrogenase [Atlantibacter sp. SORGH_AS_0304]